MPEKIIESFEVRYLEILDVKGDVDESLMPSLSHAEIQKMYELLVLSRTFDRHAISLQREGRI
ncbi:MAG: hypothetical protein L0Y56_13445, partial [Nitrospira sp.]|nr:hypothetical protein [Nitrospira sp.]